MPSGCRLVNGHIVGPYMLLSNTDLRNGDLSEISLEHAYLTGANIQGANILKTDFRKVESLYQVTTGLHPYDEDIGTAKSVQLPIDDDFTPLLPGDYAFALGYIFGPNLTLLGEDLAWVDTRNRAGSLIPRTLSKFLEIGGAPRGYAGEVKNTRANDANSYKDAWSWISYYDGDTSYDATKKETAEAKAAIYDPDAPNMVLKGEWEEVNSHVYRHVSKTGIDGKPIIRNYLSDDMMTKGSGAGGKPFIIAGISLKNTVFKVDSFFNVQFIREWYFNTA